MPRYVNGDTNSRRTIRRHIFYGDEDTRLATVATTATTTRHHVTTSPMPMVQLFIQYYTRSGLQWGVRPSVRRSASSHRAGDEVTGHETFPGVIAAKRSLENFPMIPDSGHGVQIRRAHDEDGPRPTTRSDKIPPYARRNLTSIRTWAIVMHVGIVSVPFICT